jgi:hypothetical protein
MLGVKDDAASCWFDVHVTVEPNFMAVGLTDATGVVG